MGSLLDMSESELAEQLAGCSAVVSCLGHREILWGPTPTLNSDATKKVCAAAASASPQQPLRFALLLNQLMQRRQAIKQVPFKLLCCS